MLKPISVLCLASLISLTSSLPLFADSKPSQGLPGRRVGGGSRGCQELQGLKAIDPKQLIALMPQNNVGKTATAHPTLFFRIPKLPSPKSLEFVLRDDRDQRVYKTTFQSPADGGILSLSLSASEMPPLAVGKPYHWYFSIICNARDRSKDITVEGNLQRVQLTTSLANQLQRVTPTDRVNVLLANGLWQDALATVMLLRQTRPQDPTVASQWAELLKSAGLGTIAKDTILTQSQPRQSMSVTP